MRNLSRTNIFWLVVLLVVLALFILPNTGGSDGQDLTWSKFTTLVEQNKVKDVTIQGQEIRGKLEGDEPFVTTGPLDFQGLSNMLTEHGVPHKYEVVGDDSIWLTAVFTLVPLLVVVLLFVWLMRNIQGTNGRAMSFGKAKAKLHSDTSKRVTFEDVAGIEESKEELQEIIDFLKDPRKFTRLGGRIPKGVLLMGPPGTGKTLLARAVAGEAAVPFFSISGSDFVEMFVGVGASRVRDLFDQGKKHAPCIIFIDEIDAVGRHRGAGLGGGHDEREQTLNQLLVEMDGFEGTEGVILVAATNRPDVLDPALLRPGRFDRRIVVPSPDVRGRARILEIHTRRIPLADDVDLRTVAKGTPGFSGADLENLCNEAALLAARNNKRQVDHQDFEQAREKIFMGPERRSMLMPEHEKKNTAYHEAGHAIVAHMMRNYDPVHKVTIVPRGRALGVTWTLPDEDRLSYSRTYLLQQLAMMMGGRAAEELALNEVTGGAKDDIKRATRVARQMVCDLGMSEDLGPVNWGDANDEVFIGRQMAQVQSYSENTAQRIDGEVKRLLTRAYDSATTILRQNVHVLHRVAQTLIERESLDRAEFVELVEEAGPIYPTGLAWMGV